MLSTIKKFDASIWEEILNNTVTKIGIDELAVRLKPPCSLKAVTMFLDIFEVYDDDRPLKALIQCLLADPENLAVRSAKEGLEPTTHLLFRMRHNDSREIRPFIKFFSKTVVFESFYGPGGPGPTALFLRNAWCNVGPSTEFDSLWNDKLIKIGHSGLCRWTADRNPALLLGRTLELWGMLSCFSRNIRWPVPTRLPSICLPKREMCSTILSLKEYEDFGPTAACVLGVVALCLNISSETACAARERLELARTEMENQNPFINQLVEQSITWLIAEGG